MYKTNAKRKSHILKNHPDCELPEKPTDKVRNRRFIMINNKNSIINMMFNCN